MTEELTPKTVNDYIENAKTLGYHLKVSQEMAKSPTISEILSKALTNTTITFGGSNTSSGSSMVRRHRTVFDNREKCPDCGEISSLNNIIMHLNDVARWSREEIADWLDTLDNQPIFYPDTCPEDCECELCKPNINWLDTSDTIASGSITSANLTSGELVLTSNSINQAALQLFYGKEIENNVQSHPHYCSHCNSAGTKLCAGCPAAEPTQH